MYTCSPACTRACGCDCMCMHCLWPPKAGKGYLPQHLSTFCFGPGYGTDLELTWLAGLIAQSAPAIFLCLSPRAGIPGMCQAWSLYTTAGDSWGYELGFLRLGSKRFTGEPCLQPFSVVFCMENGLVAATTETVRQEWGLRLTAKDNRGLSCRDSMAKLKIWPLGPTESEEWEFLTIISYSGTPICNFLQMKSGVRNKIEKNDSWRTQQMSTLRNFALYSA